MAIECGILNRLRGTGTIYSFGTYIILNKNVEITFNGNIAYALYLSIIGSIFYNNDLYIFNQLIPVWLIAVFIATSYITGESKGWGEWVGALTRTEPKDITWLNEQYKDDEGKKFPYVHYIANSIEPEQIEGTLGNKIKQYNKYAKVALAIRGFIWWMPVYLTLYLVNIINIYFLLVPVLLGILFPISCFLGKQWNYTAKFGLLSFSKGWENQEVIYGLFQGVLLWTSIMLSVM